MLENADAMNPYPKQKPTIKDKVAQAANSLITENPVAVALKNAYFQHVLIQKEKWSSYIKDKEKQNNTGVCCEPELLKACFEVIGALPMRKEIKHDLDQLQAKIMVAQIDLGIELNSEITWNCPRHELMQKVNALQQLIENSDKGPNDQVLFGLLYTIFKCFVNVDYNSADRYLLKVFLDTCSNSFKLLLNMEQTITDSMRLLWNSDN